MTDLEKFFQGVVCLDTFGSEESDVRLLSDIIASSFPEAFQPDEDDDYETLYEYWDDCRGSDWQIIYVEHSKRLNALRYDTATTYARTHPMLTAEHFLQEYEKSTTWKDFKEDELMSLFGD